VKKIAVIGVGPAGLTDTYQLAKEAIPGEIFEADTTVGVMAKTNLFWSQKVDFAPHRFLVVILSACVQQVEECFYLKEPPGKCKRLVQACKRYSLHYLDLARGCY